MVGRRPDVAVEVRGRTVLGKHGAAGRRHVLDVVDLHALGVGAFDQPFRIGERLLPIRDRHATGKILVLKIDHQQGRLRGIEAFGSRSASDGSDGRVLCHGRFLSQSDAREDRESCEHTKVA
ncbi:hypothetical protein D9M69_646950 [compost metagenome]